MRVLKNLASHKTCAVEIVNRRSGFYDNLLHFSLPEEVFNRNSSAQQSVYGWYYSLRNLKHMRIITRMLM